MANLLMLSWEMRLPDQLKLSPPSTVAQPHVMETMKNLEVHAALREEEMAIWPEESPLCAPIRLGLTLK